MEQVLSSGSSMITEASGNARELAEQIGAQPTMEGLIVMGIVGLLICFFGLKLIRLQAALVGFLMGALIGIGVAWTAGISGLTFAIVVFACGAVLAALSFFLYKFGVFCVVFCVCLGMGVQIADPQSTLPLVIVLAIALILAIVAVIFVEPAIIICTGISGGVTAGISAAAAMGLEGIWPGYAIGAVAAILGMVVQFMMHSRKVGKKEKVYAEQVKEADSVESEVEKARMVLDDPEEPEDEDE
ncbi:MAG TPA: TMEM198/TM7SF3 family protein [Candidatus Dorea merdavium]|nr:hypothetical protein [Massilistercora timonensis]HIY54914.1 TMEM198/TM7SF3 family protein [Candidatus Dorea merdavium]